MKGISEHAAAQEADSEKKRRRRQNRRSKQSLPCVSGGGCGSVGVLGRWPENGRAEVEKPPLFNSLPSIHINSGSEGIPTVDEEEISRSCPLPASSSPPPLEAAKNGPVVPNKGKVKYFDPYLPESDVEEAIKKGYAFRATFRVNAHNCLEAYCTIDGVPTDILINGALAQNRAIEGDVVAITVDPVASWTRLKGSNDAREVFDDNKVRKERVDTYLEKPCSSGSGHHCHGNGKVNEAIYCDSENGANVGCAFEVVESTRALERICSMVSLYPSKRPTGRVLSIITKSPRREAVIGFLAATQWLSEVEGYTKQIKGPSPIALGKEYIQLIPTDSKFPNLVVVLSSLADHVKERLCNGDVTVASELVAARIDEWSEESFHPQAYVMHIFGRGGEIEPNISAILYQNAICASSFSPESMDCLPDIQWEIPTEEFITRKDLRNACTFTIDPSSASDLDDALSVEMLSNEIFRVGVHIADVSYFVCPKTALDTEAQIRSTSVYILQHRVPMLPPRLSEELASLLPGVDKLAVSIIFDINRSGDIVDRWIGRSIIRSCCKLSYDFVQDLIDGSMEADQLNGWRNSSSELHGRFEWKDVIKSLTYLHEISKKLRERRFKGGALMLENAKLGFSFDDCGTPYCSFFSERKESCFIVEEFMLLANTSVAEVISRAFPDSALLRRHPEPNMRRLREFEGFCIKYGFELDASSSRQFHLSLSKIREKLKNDPVLFDILVSYASKPMQSASYFCTGDLRGRENDWAHYALSIPFYTHFTSPIRRYPDIIVHRILYAAIDAEEAYMKQRLISPREHKSVSRCFTGINFDKDAAESKEGREALTAAALKFRVPGTDALAEVAVYCNKRSVANRHAEEAGEKLYLWALLKKKEVVISEARVLGLGPRFMSVYITKLAIERRISYDDVEGLTVEWLEATSTLVLDLLWNKPFRRRIGYGRFRALEDAVLVKDPSHGTVCEEGSHADDSAASNASSEPSVLADEKETDPAFFPLVLKQLSTVPVALHAVGGDDGPLEIGVRLYMCSYFRKC